MAWFGPLLAGSAQQQAGGGGGVAVTPAQAMLTLTAFAPSVAITNNQVVTPAQATLMLTPFAPTIVVNQNVTPTNINCGRLHPMPAHPWARHFSSSSLQMGVPAIA